MARLLVSFCNCTVPDLALGLFDTSDGSFRWVDFGAQPYPITGVTGVCLSRDRCWCVINSGGQPTRLAVLDSAFNVERTYDLTEVEDGHSIIEYQAGFLINDTAKNRLVYVECRAERAHELPFWSLETTERDVYHVNSVVCLDGEVFVSTFGAKPQDGWAAATDGRIINVSRSEVVCGGLLHPHSLTVIDGVLHWLESRTGRVQRYTQVGGVEVVAEISGYLRGLAADREYLYVGASAHRRRSRSTGTMNAPIARSLPEAHSWFYQIHRATSDIKRTNFTAYGSEIYDLARVPETFRVQVDAGNAIARRIWRLEDELSETREHLEAIITQRDARISELEHTIDLLTARLKDGRATNEPCEDGSGERADNPNVEAGHAASGPGPAANGEIRQAEEALHGARQSDKAPLPDAPSDTRTATGIGSGSEKVVPVVKRAMEQILGKLHVKRSDRSIPRESS